MSITNVYKSILQFLRTVSYSTVTQSVVEGEVTDTVGTASSIQLACFPITFKDLKILPYEEYSTQDYKFYRVGTDLLELNSIITLDGTEYRVSSLSDRTFDGNFSIYYGKKIN
jgi:hypothetical protein